ncbi:MAG: hypothetical protein FWG65_09565 [Turicibacter sp.]|nr:hypothetical protein [Turicibacter sp.]
MSKKLKKIPIVEQGLVIDKLHIVAHCFATAAQHVFSHIFHQRVARFVFLNTYSAA